MRAGCGKCTADAHPHAQGAVLVHEVVQLGGPLHAGGVGACWRQGMHPSACRRLIQPLRWEIRVGQRPPQAARLADSAKACEQRPGATLLVLDMRGRQPRDRTRSPASSRGAAHCQGRARERGAVVAGMPCGSAPPNARPRAECRVVTPGRGAAPALKAARSSASAAANCSTARSHSRLSRTIRLARVLYGSRKRMSRPSTSLRICRGRTGLLPPAPPCQLLPRSQARGCTMECMGGACTEHGHTASTCAHRRGRALSL